MLPSYFLNNSKTQQYNNKFVYKKNYVFGLQMMFSFTAVIVNYNFSTFHFSYSQTLFKIMNTKNLK